MAAEEMFVRNLRDTCIICCNQFQINQSRVTWLDSIFLHTRRIQICSSVCRWQMQYALGIVHGFLLHDICQKLVDTSTLNCEKGKIFAQSPEYTYLCDNTTGNITFHCGETSEINIPVKTEESVSDLEDFDCTVSFQNSVPDSIEDIREKTADSDVHQIPATHLQNKSAQSVSRMVHSCVRASNRKVSESGNKKTKQKACCSIKGKLVKENRSMQKSTDEFCEKSLELKDQTKSRTRNKKGAEIKLCRTLKRKREEKKNWDSGNSTDVQHKEKRPKLSQEEAEETAKATKPDNGEDAEMLCQCDFCSKSFTARRFLQRHLNRFHPKEIETSCDVCGDSCRNQKYLSIHVRKEHSLKLSEGEELYHCDQCSKSFNSRRGLALHKEFVHSEENPVNCQLCNLTLKNEIYLKRHLKRSHSDSIICHICGAKFKSRLALSSHLSAHKGVKSFFCEVCGMGFVRKTSLRRHVQQHADLSYSCDSCPSSYKTWGSLSLHMLQVHQKGSYFTNRLKSAEKLGYVVDKEAVDRHWNGQCVSCGEKLVSGACGSHPTSYALMFKCHRCELTAEHVDDLLAHLRDHDSGLSTSSLSVSFDCKVCHKAFPRKLYLKQHLKKHHPGASMTSLSPQPATLTYRCQVCGKQFGHKQYLYVHMKQHLQPGTFVCHVCDRKFTYKCNLKNHLSTHSEDKPFKCEVCLKPFRRKEVLNSHRLVHNPNLSPFKCHLCGKGLSRKQYLKKHYKIMHPECQESQQVPGTST